MKGFLPKCKMYNLIHCEVGNGGLAEIRFWRKIPNLVPNSKISNDWAELDFSINYRNPVFGWWTGDFGISVTIGDAEPLKEIPETGRGSIAILGNRRSSKDFRTIFRRSRIQETCVTFKSLCVLIVLGAGRIPWLDFRRSVLTRV